MTKKRIFFLIPSLQTGGAETVLVNLLSVFDHQKYEITVATILGKGILIEKIPKEVRLIQLTNNVLLFRIANYLYSKYGITLFIKYLVRKLKGDYDAVFCFLDGVFTDYIFSSNLKFKKYYAVVQSSYSSYKQKTKYLKGKHIKRTKMRYEQLDGIIAPSISIKRDFIKIFGSEEKIHIIYNPINAKKVLSNADKKLEIELLKDTINIVAIGRLIQVKGYENLIEACLFLKNKSLNFSVSIIGTGPLYNDLNTKIFALGLENHVKLTGFIDNPYPIVKAADIFIMTSFSEGLPTALIEAEILGKPIIATNVSGCNEVIDHGNYGVLVEPNPEAIAAGLEQLITNKELRAKYALLAIEGSKLFDDNKTLQSYYNLIDA